MKNANLWNKLITIDGEDTTKRSMCDILRDTDPELEEVEGHTEQYYGVTDDYYEWERVTENLPSFNIYSTIHLRPFSFIDKMVYDALVYHLNSRRHPVTEQHADKIMNRYMKVTDITRVMTTFLNRVVNKIWDVFRQDNDKYVFFDCFKECKGFMSKSVGIYDYEPIEAKTYKFDDVKDLVEFVNDNKDRLVIYYCRENKDRLQLRCVVLGNK